MPLIELLNNKPDFFYYNGGPGNFTQKSMPFDKDRPHTGYSGLPYIKFPIYANGISDDFRKYYNTNRGGLDFPIRGGAIDFDAQSRTVTPSNDLDKQRIRAFLNDKPRGDIFLLKQVGLQLSNPKIQTGTQLYSITKNQVLSILENTRVYNMGKNTLEQVGLQGTGIHITRNGILPYDTVSNYYANTLYKESLMSVAEAEINNRLLILKNLKMNQVDNRDTTRINFGNSAKRISQLGISYNRNILFEYLGGPGSVYGIGQTTINRAKGADTAEAINYKQMPMTSMAMTYEAIREQSSARPNGSGKIKNYQDFRSKIDEYSGGRLPNSFWNGAKGIPVKYPDESLALISPQDYAIQFATAKALEDKNNNRVDVRFFDASGKIDKINKLAPFTVTDNSKSGWDQSGPDSDDIIKFGFECISNDDRKSSTFLFFRAFLSTITDNNQASINGFKYMGRAENFYTYGGFERSISFGFKLVAMSEQELLPIYEKLNYLVSQVYPDYHPITGIMRAPLVKLTIGNYLDSIPGFLESVNFTFDQNSPWEISQDSQLAHYIDVNVSFKPIFKELPQRSTNGYNHTKIISAVTSKANATTQQNTQKTQNTNIEDQQQIEEDVNKLVSIFGKINSAI